MDKALRVFCRESGNVAIMLFFCCCEIIPVDVVEVLETVVGTDKVLQAIGGLNREDWNPPWNRQTVVGSLGDGYRVVGNS